ncbi:MAG: arginine--tRNA ligase [Candidatus Yanofskybacteria bacterium]|nr:arginine--tRNA ligase [Candidatus Yanofskybacteria bacterium]
MFTWLKEQLGQYYAGYNPEIQIPTDPKLGDYATNLAFTIAKQEHKNPLEVAKEIAGKFADAPEFEKVEASAPGFVNFFLKQEFLQNKLGEIHNQKEEYGKSDLGKDKKVIIEYSAPNIAKPMHVGHLRSTIIGDTLANMYSMVGYEVIRWNYIGDWGTQFGKLIVAYKKWNDPAAFEKQPIEEMVRLYVKFHEELKNNPELEEQAREEFRKLEQGDQENRKLWEQFRELSTKEFEKMYQLLGVRFDETKGESDYEKVLPDVTAMLEKQGLLKESEGAKIIEIADLPPALVQKADGASLYITRDIASLQDRIKNYHPHKILYVVANQQALHFQQLFAVATMLWWTDVELAHVKYGLVLGEDGKKFSTREGNAVPLQEVIEKITSLAQDVVKQKNPQLSEEETKEIAQAIGIGALKYNDLKQHPYSDIVFDWEAMLDLSGNSGPYIQYTYARLSHILDKAGKPTSNEIADLDSIEERLLMKHLLDFPHAIEHSVELYTANALALYLYELANYANRFYENHRVLEDENKNRQQARLVLVATVATVLKQGLGLLGITAPERI